MSKRMELVLAILIVLVTIGISDTYFTNGEISHMIGQAFGEVVKSILMLFVDIIEQILLAFRPIWIKLMPIIPTSVAIFILAMIARNIYFKKKPPPKDAGKKKGGGGH